MDNVNSPSHYNFGDIEVIDYIRDKLSKDQFTGYCLGNVLKYVSRWEHKGGLEDLKKARVYLNWAIEELDVIPVIKVDPNDFHVADISEVQFHTCDECGRETPTLFKKGNDKNVCYRCWHKSEDDLK